MALDDDYVLDKRGDFVIGNVGQIFIDLCDYFISDLSFDHFSEVPKHDGRRNHNQSIEIVLCQVVSEHGCELAGEQSFQCSMRIAPRFDSVAGVPDRFVNPAGSISAEFVARRIGEARLRSSD